MTGNAVTTGPLALNTPIEPEGSQMPITPQFLAAAASITLFASPALASQPDTAGMQKLLSTLETAWETSDEALFRHHWHPAGYAQNLVGGSGLTGKSAFRQGARKNWYFKPDMAKLHQDGRDGLFIVPCDVWSWKDNRAVDHVWVLPVWVAAENRMVVLGAGESLDQVVALARRYVAKQPLAPPPKS